MFSAADKLKMPDEFSDQEKFIDYFSALSISTQMTMAENGVAIAQRLVASYFHDKKDYAKSTVWWNKAATNKDPVALLHQADVCVLAKEFQQAKTYCDLALESLTDCKDSDFAEYVREIANNTMMRIAAECFDLGVIKYNEQEMDGAKIYFNIAMDLGDPAAAFNLAKIEHAIKNYKKAIFCLEMTLFLAEESNSPSEFRGAAHNMLGTIKADLLPDKVNYKDILEVAGHFQKANLYVNNAGYRENKNAFLGTLPASIKSSILTDSAPLKYKNGIVKTFHETMAKPDISEKELGEFLSYSDPRKLTMKENNVGEEKEINKSSVLSADNSKVENAPKKTSTSLSSANNSNILLPGVKVKNESKEIDKSALKPKGLT